MKRNDKALLLNAKENTITEVVIKDYTDISRLIGCNYFTTVQVNAEGDTLYVDDEGLINGTDCGFLLEGYDGRLMGNAILLGTNRATGDSKDATMSAKDLAKLVKCFNAVPNTGFFVKAVGRPKIVA
jgi:hypothetical protein